MLYLFGCIISLFLFQTTNMKNANWTIMVYLNADNNLERYGIKDFNEMENVGSSANVNIVVQFDRTPGYDYSNGNWTTCRRYLITQDEYPDSITSELIEDIGEVDMGDYNTLADFGKWAKSNYPANHYLLVIWNHGDGWEKGSSEPVKTVSYDASSGNEISIANGELAQALSMIGNVDIIGFDACLMQMWEVMENVAPYASYMVGSEETEPLDGWDYTGFMRNLNLNPMMDPLTLGKSIVNNTYQSTLSVVALDQIRDLTLKIDTFALELMRAKGEGYGDILKSVRSYLHHFADWAFIDLYNFADKIKSASVPEPLKEVSSLVMASTKNAVKEVNNSCPSAYGISIYHPSSPTYYKTLYDNLEVAKLTRWDEYLKGYLYSDSLGVYPEVNDNWTGRDTIIYDGDTYSFWGNDGDPSFYAAVRFTPAKPCTLIAIIARLNYEFNYMLYIYSAGKDSRPGSVIHSQAGSSVNGWNYIQLDQPIVSQYDSDFWAAIYSINAYYPIGIDNGKYPTHRSLYSFDGKNWAEPTQYSNFYNFNIRADIKYFLTPSSIEEENIEYKSQIIKLSVSPNPFTRKVCIKWSGISTSYGEKQKINLQIYDLSGRLVKTLITNPLSLTSNVEWDGTDFNNDELQSGIYFICLETDTLKTKTKLLKVK